MKIAWTPVGWEEYLFWQQTDRKIVKRINQLIKDTTRDPFDGLGKPEPLMHELSGWWSRRINGEHRLIYRVHENDDGALLEIASCRFHY